MSFRVLVDEELLDHIGSPLTKSQREAVRVQKIEEIHTLQQKAYHDGFQDGVQKSRIAQNMNLQKAIRTEEIQRLKNLEHFENDMRQTLHRAPVHQLECQSQRSLALECYRSSQDPLKCAGVVNEFAACARLACEKKFATAKTQ
eukprot:c11044_g1_i1.p1 GENE.c11044_g1_i1~~c11044_g1_i1.p1  ORF type:complete len:144 (-),score=59.69 c11044_g1_i1:28-459(-)